VLRLISCAWRLRRELNTRDVEIAASFPRLQLWRECRGGTNLATRANGNFLDLSYQVILRNSVSTHRLGKIHTSAAHHLAPHLSSLAQSSLARKRGTQLTHPSGMKARIFRLIELRIAYRPVSRTILLGREGGTDQTRSARALRSESLVGNCFVDLWLALLLFLFHRELLCHFLFYFFSVDPIPLPCREQSIVRILARHSVG
jgi:hypothetical protein